MNAMNAMPLAQAEDRLHTVKALLLATVSSWGNQAAVVTAADVAKVRAAALPQ